MDTPLSHQMNLSETRWKQVTMTPIWSSFIWHFSPNVWNERSVVVAAVAQKEEEALNRWKETQRVPSVCVNPERLGNLSLPSTFTISIFIFTSSLTDIWHSDLLSRWWCHTGWSQAKTANKSSIHETAEESTCQVIHSGKHPFIFCGALHISKYYSKLFTHTIFVCCHKKKTDSAWKHAIWDAVIHFYFSSHPLLFIQK